jgi:hypothetical protein
VVDKEFAAWSFRAYFLGEAGLVTVNEWEVLTMKIRPPDGRVKRSRTVSAVRQATSRKAREVAHPQLFRSMLKDKPALYFHVKVAHPPITLMTLGSLTESFAFVLAIVACHFGLAFFGPTEPKWQRVAKPCPWLIPEDVPRERLHPLAGRIKWWS